MEREAFTSQSIHNPAFDHLITCLHKMPETNKLLATSQMDGFMPRETPRRFLLTTD